VHIWTTVGRLGAWALGLATCVVLGVTDASAQSGVRAGWDAAVMTGLFVGHPGRLDRFDSSLDDWYHAGTLALSAGRHLTPNLKIEGEALISREGRRVVQQFVEGFPRADFYAVGGEQRVRTNGISAGLTWQFYENRWVHPFVFGGVALDFDRTRVETWPRWYYSDPLIGGDKIVVASGGVEDLGTSREVRGVMGTGAKLYMAKHAFFKTDARVNVGGHRSGHVSFRLGVGFDF
jgi:hypothetical protein